MANGTYGTKRPAVVQPDDIEVFYHYRPTRSSVDNDFSESFKKYSGLTSNIIEMCSYSSDETSSFLPGMYNLRLPLDTFGKKGFYTIYLKPKEILTNIVDVSTLMAYPNIRGVVFDITNFGGSVSDLVGYRMEFRGDSGEYSGEYRIITSCNRCEPVTTNLTNNTQKSTKYRFNQSSNLVFCTVTPSASSSFGSVIPYIGQTNDNVSLISTKFSPVMFEIEMTEHDADTISTMLEGDQIRNLDHGIITTFDKDGGIYHQAEYGRITNPDDGIHHEFKFNKDRSNMAPEEQYNLELIKGAFETNNNG